MWLLACGAVAAAGAASAAAPDDRRARLLARLLLFFALLLGPLLLLGMVQQATGLPAIRLDAGVAVALPCAAGLWWGRARSGRARWNREAPARQPISRVALAVAALVALLYVFLGAMLLTGFPRGFEVQAYHLPLAVNIFREGGIDLWDNAFMHAYPANASLWDGMFLDALPEKIASAANLPFLALAAVASYVLSRAAGADGSLSLLFSAGLATIPVFSFSAIEVGADVAGVAFMVIAVYFALARPLCYPSWPVLAGLAAGLAFGFKSLHLIPIAVLGCLLLWHGAAAEGRRFSVRQFAPALTYGLCAFAVAFPWLLRNWIATGNPLYPVYYPGLFDLLGWPGAPDIDFTNRSENQFEWVTAPWQWLVYPWVEGHFLGQNFKHSSGFGAFVAAVLLPGLLLGGARLAARGRELAAGRRAMLLDLLILIVAITGAWWVLDDRQPRYVMAAIALAIPFCAWAASDIGGSLRRLYEATAGAAILLMGAVVFVALGIETGGRLLQNAGAPRHAVLEYPAVLDRLPQGATVLNLAERTANYAAYGRQLGNRVVGRWSARLTYRAPDGVWQLPAEALQNPGIDYVYAPAAAEIRPLGCMTLEEIDRIARTPFNGVALPEPRVVYAARPCAQAGTAVAPQ